MLNVTDSAALAREWRFSRRAEHFGVQVGANRFGYVYEAIGNRTWASSNGIASVVRDPFRRDLVARIENRVNGVAVSSLAYVYDALSRPVSRNADTFGYNARGEVVSSHGGTKNTEETYAYDHIGNAVLAAFGGITNAYTANALNQYASILRASVSPCEPTYDADGNLTAFGPWAFAYDAASRLVSVSSNGIPLVTNFYDAQSRRVRKATPEATATCFYDGWNLVEERVAYVNGATSTIRYYWGKDLSDSLQGAGGIGGLLYLTVDGEVYVPFYDNNGNVTHYLDANGGIAAVYKYDAFGKTVTQSGPLSNFFRHRFSTKYHDAETGLYYYGYRFYSPSLMRWHNRDPIEEDGGVNLYAVCENNAICNFDSLGKKIAISEERYNVRDNIGRNSRAYFSRDCSINIYCTTFGVLKIDGVAYRKLFILTPGHDRWNERYKRYNEKWGVGRNSTQEWQAAYAHEMDHWNSFNALFAFLQMLNEFDGTRLCSKCDEMKDELAKQYRTLYTQAVMRSSKYDSPDLNYGGAYPK